MKKTIFAMSILILLPLTIATAQDNKLTSEESANGWKLLFNGKSADSWMNAKTGIFPGKGWLIEDGALKIVPGAGGGDIVTKEKFRNYDFKVDFLYKPGANSGIKYFIDTEREGGKLASIGCEYQILDNRLHPDAKEGINGNRKLSSLYDLIPAGKVNDHGADKWNTAEIIVRGNKVQHWLNGRLTLEYEKGSEAWKKALASSKFKDTKGFADVTDSRILLQEHENEVWFKNIKIREIN